MRLFRRRLKVEERTLSDGRLVIVLPPKITAKDVQRFKEIWLRDHGYIA